MCQRERRSQSSDDAPVIGDQRYGRWHASPGSHVGAAPPAKLQSASYASQQRGQATAVCAICLVYLAQGLLACSSLPLEYMLKDGHGLRPASAQGVATLRQLPWLGKPALALLVDACRAGGGSTDARPRFLLLSAMLLCSGWAVASLGPQWGVHASGLMIAMLAASLGMALADVVVDGLICSFGTCSGQRCGAGPSGHFTAVRLIAIARGCKTAGSLLGEAASAYLLTVWQPRYFYHLLSRSLHFALPVITLIQASRPLQPLSFSCCHIPPAVPPGCMCVAGKLLSAVPLSSRR